LALSASVGWGKAWPSLSAKPDARLLHCAIFNRKKPPAARPIAMRKPGLTTLHEMPIDLSLLLFAIPDDEVSPLVKQFAAIYLPT
jgi:hypothetical protein